MYGIIVDRKGYGKMYVKSIVGGIPTYTRIKSEAKLWAEECIVNAVEECIYATDKGNMHEDDFISSYTFDFLE